VTIVKQDTVSGLSSRSASSYLFIWSVVNPDGIEWRQYCDRAEPSTVATAGCFLENWVVQGYTGNRKVTWWSRDWLVGWLFGDSLIGLFMDGSTRTAKTCENFLLFSLVSSSLDSWHWLDWAI